MKTITCQEIIDAVAKLCIEACHHLGDDVLKAFEDAAAKETAQGGKEILKLLTENARIAKEDNIPICQDTGFAVVFLEIGQQVKIEGGDINQAINEGVRLGYKKGYLRKSIVGHPLNRVNTGDNTPCVIHTTMVPGENIKITVAPKGGGSENMSALKMLKPAEGVEGVKEFIINTVKNAGPNPCPPLIVGVGIGGTMEKAAIMAKEALLRDIGSVNPQRDLAQLEDELLEEINKLGIGPQGLGGRTTALAVHIKTFGTHIASLPVAVNLNCHASRHKSVLL
ncbi:fumarate hydratase [Desulfofalx alkaliphila]|uniref:fumarate hydratase n=1 Tax=Desulfofalx alkaliphila TaxID=105483 RepID=UPI0004E0B4AD|nr:fumarate hydratase [Desulfofalx alkaliphila]